MAQIKTIIVLRNDSTAAWTDSSAVLQKGETAIEFLKNGKVKMKVGTQEKGQLWKDAPYLGGDENEVYQVESFENLPTEDVTKGDIGIVSQEENQTAYVYTGSVWAAMNGNYDATNVYLTENLTLAGNFTSVGNYDKGDVITAGTSLQEILSGMLQQELFPTANLPTMSISASNGSGEVGSSYTVPTATLKIDSVGSYTQGPSASGVTFDIGDVKLAEGADPGTATNYTTNANVMALNSTITLKANGDTALYTDSPKSYTFSAVGLYSDGVIPKTNLNKDYPDAQIKSDSIEAADKTVSFSGYRYAFAGSTNAASIDSAIVRAATAKKSSKTSMDSESEALEFSAPAGATKVFFAYPSGWTGTPYFEMFGLAWAENNNFAAKSNVNVADARGTNEDGSLNGSMAYKLYVWELDTPLAAESTKFRVYFK